MFTSYSHGGGQLTFPYRFINGLINLKDAMIKWTQIDTWFDEHLLLSYEHLLKMPFVFVTTEDKFELTETEKKNVKNILRTAVLWSLTTPLHKMISAMPKPASKK